MQRNDRDQQSGGRHGARTRRIDIGESVTTCLPELCIGLVAESRKGALVQSAIWHTKWQQSLAPRRAAGHRHPPAARAERENSECGEGTSQAKKSHAAPFPRGLALDPGNAEPERGCDRFGKLIEFDHRFPRLCSSG